MAPVSSVKVVNCPLKANIDSSSYGCVQALVPSFMPAEARGKSFKNEYCILSAFEGMHRVKMRFAANAPTNMRSSCMQTFAFAPKEPRLARPRMRKTSKSS